MTPLRFSSIDLSTLALLGQGEFGKAFAFGNEVLKITSQPAEFEAAVLLMKEPREWHCAIYQVEPLDAQWWILKERLSLPVFEAEHARQKFPGHFWGMHNPAYKWKGLATRPTELCQGIFHHPEQEGQPCMKIKFSPAELDELQSIYPEAQRKCFRWLMETYWTATEEGFDACDLWCNFGQRADGSFACYEIARK